MKFLSLDVGSVVGKGLVQHEWNGLAGTFISHGSTRERKRNALLQKCSTACGAVDCSVINYCPQLKNFFFRPPFFKSWRNISSENEPLGTALCRCEELSNWETLLADQHIA